MRTTTLADKIRQQLMDRIDHAMNEVDDALMRLGGDGRAGAAWDAEVLQANVDAARAAQAPGIEKLTALLNAAQALAATIRQRGHDRLAARRRITLQRLTDGALTGARPGFLASHAAGRATPAARPAV